MESVRDSVLAVAEANGAAAGLARIALLAGEGELWRLGGAPPSAQAASHTLIFLRPPPEPRAPASLGLSDWPVFSGSSASRPSTSRAFTGASKRDWSS